MSKTLEKLLFSDQLIKINKYGMKQDRSKVITNKAVYNFRKKDLKRRLEINKLLGITVSSKTEEYVLHGKELEYDYHYISSRRKQIIKIISTVYENLMGKELPLCQIDAKTLVNVVTLKSDKKKDISYSRMPNAGFIPISTFLYGETNTSPVIDSEEIKKNGTIVKKKSTTQEVSLQHFKPLKVLGRGSFGKVTMVEHVITKELYAMKTLKKDILIDQDQIENTLLEKEILQDLEHPFLVGLEYCFQTDDRIYFIMPFMHGGELFQHLRKFRIFDEEK